MKQGPLDNIELEFLDLDPWVLGEEGKTYCPKGYKQIRDAKTCQNASNALSLTYDANQNDEGVNRTCNLCGGCNPATTRVDSKYGVKAKWICQKSRFIKVSMNLDFK